MKKILLATAAMFGLTGAAFAGADRPVTFLTYGEYAVEAEAFEIGVGADVTIAAVPDLALGVTAVVIDNTAQNFEFDHVDLTAGYVVATGAELYGKVTFDADLEYSETTVGVALSF